MTYEFTLVLDREPSDAELDKLVAAGLEDIGVEGPSPALAHVAVDADTIAAAMLDALHQLESAGFAVIGVQSNDLVSLKDIAARLGRTYESVRKLAVGERGPGAFPAPMSTGQWALYSWTAVSDWLARHFPMNAVGCTAYDREIAAADHLIRARCILAGDKNRAELAKLIDA